MKRTALLILVLLLAFAAGVAADSFAEVEVHLDAGDTAIVTCSAGELHSEPIDDLTYTHRCGGEPTEAVYLPVWERE